MAHTFTLRSWLTILCLLLNYPFSAFAQNGNSIPAGYDASKQPDFSTPSPNVASLGKFGLTQVSYYTGVPQVSIPLWEIKGKQLRVPITLSYNNTGLKVTEEASWVGLGWALQAGGIITQEVRGNADDLSFVSGASGPHLPYQLPPTPFGTTSSEPLMNRVAQGIQDSSPDVFHYTFGQYSGRFILRDSTARQLLYNDLQITYDYANHRFTVVTGDGTVYKFFQRESTTNDNLTGSTSTISSSWLLTEITSANGTDTITLTYAATPELYVTPTDHMVDDNYTGYPRGNVYNSLNQNALCGAYDNIAPHEQQMLSRSIITAYRLERIESQTERVEFVPQIAPRQDVNGQTPYHPPTTAYALASIQVYDKSRSNAAPVRTFHLYSSYFTDAYGSSAISPRTGRLRLDSLQEIGQRGGTKPAYRFAYQDGRMPDRASRNLDHWGYYNFDPVNYNYNVSLVPATLHYPQGTAHREPVFQAALLTTLQKITYPTGGSETFTYEPNVYKPDADSMERPGPGVRIKQIVAQAAGSAPTYRTFTYLTPVDPWLVPHYEKTLVNNPGTICDCMLVTVSGRSPSVFSMFASVVQYTQVTETLGVAGEGGQTEYHFEGIAYADRAAGMQQVRKLTRTASQQLLREEITAYAQTGDLFLPVFTDPTALCGPDVGLGCIEIGGAGPDDTGLNFMLEQIDGTWTNVLGCYNPPNCSCGGQASPPTTAHRVDRVYGFKLNYYAPSFVTLPCLWNRLVQQRVRTYDATNDQLYSESTTNYYYDQSDLGGTNHFVHRYLTRQETTDSQGRTRITRTRYPQDYGVGLTAGNDAYYGGLQRLVALHQVELPVEQLTLTKTGGTVTALAGQMTLFKAFGTAQNIQPASLLALETSTPLPDGVFSGTTTNQLRWDSHFVPKFRYRYDSNGDLIEWHRNQHLAACVRDNKTAQIIAEAQDASWAQLASTSFEPGASGRWVYDSVGTHLGTTHFTGTTGYLVDGTAAATISRPALPSGRYELTCWCYGSTPPLLTGASQQQVEQLATVDGWHEYRFRLTCSATTTLQLNAPANQSLWLDELRLYPVGAQLTSYTYAPLVGLTSRTEPDGRTTTYEYDDLGRLVRTRDEQGRIRSQQQYHYAGSK
jgi:YD repeat-containing protein